MPSIPYGTDLSKKSYITTEAPNGHLYTYSRTYDAPSYTWSGSLTAIDFTAAPFSTYNVAGIVLRETGKKLYADANPGVDRYMVAVFIVDQDGNNVSGDLGSMFIDPNCSVFAQFNGQRPTYIPTAEDDLAGNGLDLGNPVYTRGNITTVQGSVVVSSQAGATGSVLVGPSAAVGAGVDNAIAINTTATTDNQIITTGNITTTAGNIDAAGSILSSGAIRGIGYSTGAGGTISGANSVTINKVCGQVQFTDTILANSYVNWTINNSTVDANDVVIVNLVNNESVLFSVVNLLSGTGFTIRVLNTTGSNITNDLTFNFAVIKSVIS